jgi:hypothetical protein
VKCFPFLECSSGFGWGVYLECDEEGREVLEGKVVGLKKEVRKIGGQIEVEGKEGLVKGEETEVKGRNDRKTEV